MGEHALFGACAVGDASISFRGIATVNPDDPQRKSMSNPSLTEPNEHSTNSFGGAIAAVNVDAVKMLDVVFEHNSAANGGAIAILTHEALSDQFNGMRKNWDLNSQTVSLDKCEFHENGATKSGGAIFSTRGQISISGSQFGEAFDKTTKLCSRTGKIFDRMYDIHDKSY